MAIYTPIEQFAAPFDPSDGKLSDQEKQQAADDFKTLIDDVFLARIEDIATNEYGTYAPRIEIVDHTPEGRYRSSLEVMIWINPEGEKVLQISEQHKEYRPDLRTSIYSLREGAAEVTRVDQTEAMRRVEGPDDHHDVAIEDIQRLADRIHNFELEVQLGYNDQPVGPKEIAVLRSLVL